jgi:histidinol-phosphate aminotransferase
MSLQRLSFLKPYQTETTSCSVKMSSNENPFELSKTLKQKILNAIANVPFGRYPDPTSTKLKTLIARRFGIQPDQIVLGNGSDELIQLLTILVGDMHTCVMYPTPTFPMYQVASDVVGRKRLEIPLNEHFDLDLSMISQEELKKVGLAFFARPNNPTGNSFSIDQIKQIADSGIFTVIDEAYIDFSDREHCLSMALKSDHVVILRTLSKIGLAGIRLGILIARTDIAQKIDAARMPFNITYPSQIIAETVLTEGFQEIEEHIQIIKAERLRLFNALNEYPGIRVIPSDANFLFIKVDNGNQIHQQLIDRDILVRNMNKYASLDNYLRVSVGTPEENTLFLETIKDIYK